MRSLADAERVREVFESCGGVRRGHFRTPAGHHTAEFWEKFAVLQQPALADELFGLLAARLAALRPTVVAGPTQGGLVVAWGVARHLGCRALFLERDTRHGPFVVRRGTHLTGDDVVVLVDDLIASGDTVRRAQAAVREGPGRIAGLGCLVDRRATVPRAQAQPVPEIVSLLELTGPPNYDPTDCPLCDEGVVLSEPRTLDPV